MKDEDKTKEQLIRELAALRKRAEKSLEEERNVLRTLINSLPDAIFVKDAEGRFLVVNEPILASFKAKAEGEVIGKTDFDFMPKEWAERYLAEEQEMYRTGEPIVGQEYCVVQPTGETTWALGTKVPLRDSQGKIIGIAGINRDITQRKRMEEGLRESEERFRSIYQESPIGIALYDADGRFLSANRSYIAMLSIFDVAEMKRSHLFEDPNIPDKLKDKLLQGETVRCEALVDFDKVKELGLYRTIRSGMTHLDMVIVPLGLVKGRSPSGYLVQTQDITKRKLAEEALRRSERELRIRNQIVEIFLTVPDDEMYGEVLEVILKAMESRYGVFGYMDEDGAWICPSMTRDIWDRCQMPDKDIVFPREKWGGIWGQALVEKKTLYSNKPFRVPEGHIPILRALDVPILHQGEVIGNLLVGNREADYDQKDRRFLEALVEYIAPVLNARLERDRQERKRARAEETLKQRTHDLRERVKELNGLYGISDIVEKPGISLQEILQGTVDVIPSSCQYPKITCARVTIKGQEFVTDGFRETPWRQVSDIAVHGECVGTVEVCYLKKKPERDEGPFLKEERDLINAIAERLGRILERIWGQEELQKHRDHLEEMVQERTARLRESNEQLRLEIAERKRIEEALGLSVRQWHTTFDTIGDPICLVSLEGRIERCNKAMTELLGKPFSQIVGCTCWEVIHGMSEPIGGCPLVRMQETRCRETLNLPIGERWFRILVDPVLDKDGGLIGSVHLMSDITEAETGRGSTAED